MNNSQRTKLVAQGIALYAAYQDLPISKQDGSSEAKAWNEWAWNNKQYTALVMREQYRLFDLCNNL